MRDEREEKQIAPLNGLKKSEFILGLPKKNCTDEIAGAPRYKTSMAESRSFTP
jgi:hypothetical protein